MKYISFTRLFIAVSLILVYVIQKLVGLSNIDTNAAASIEVTNEVHSSMNLFLAAGIVVTIIISIAIAYYEAEQYLRSTTKANSDSTASKNHITNASATEKKAQQLRKGGKRKVDESRRTSSAANIEKLPTCSSKSVGSDKKASNPCTPIFQNLTNVISSPPPPLPTFDYDYDDLDFMQMKSKKVSKRNTNGSIASNDDIVSNNLLTNNTGILPFQAPLEKSKSKNNAKATSSNNVSAIHFNNVQVNGSRSQPSQSNSAPKSDNVHGNSYVMNPRRTILDSRSSSDSFDSNNANSEQNFAMPIRPPNSSSSLSTSSASSYSSPISSALPISSSSSSSASSSPAPAPESGFGEYTLLGPGVTFELPCLRGRFAPSHSLRDRLK